MSARPGRRQARVNVYNWSDYIGETTIADFERRDRHRRGLRPLRHRRGDAGQDAGRDRRAMTWCCMAGLSLPQFDHGRRLREARPGEADRLGQPRPGDPEDRRRLRPRQRQYGVPYMWGSVGFTYNLDMVKERLPDADLAQPRHDLQARECREAGRLRHLDPRQPDRHRLHGADLSRASTPTPTDAPNIDKMVEAFKPIREYIATFDNSNYLNALPNGELCVANSWSGDYAVAKARAAEAGIEIEPAVFRAEDRRTGLVRLLVHPGRCAEQGQRLHLPRLPAAPRGDRGLHRLHRLCQCQQGSDSRWSTPAIRRPGGLSRCRNAEPDVHADSRRPRSRTASIDPRLDRDQGGLTIVQTPPFVRIEGVSKLFGTFQAVDDVTLTIEQGRDLRPSRRLGLRQDHAAADARGVRRTDRRPHLPRRAGHDGRAALGAPGPHDVPELCAVSRT